MRPPSSDPQLICASCEGRIVGRAEFHVGLAFCCAGCVVGGPCTCSYDLVEPAANLIDGAADATEEPALVAV
jgi:hypothetical protein